MAWKQWKGKELQKLTQQAMGEALYSTADEIGAEADQQVPHDEGFLQDSKVIKGDPSNPGKIQIGYGGGGQSGFPEVPYAVSHHETPKNFQKGRKSNYLRDPVKTVGPKALKRNLQNEMKKIW